MPISPPRQMILAINAGSSNIKFALFHRDGEAERALEGCVEGIGTGGGCFSVDAARPEDSFERHFGIPERFNAAQVLMDWLAERIAPGEQIGRAHV